MHAVGRWRVRLGRTVVGERMMKAHVGGRVKGVGGGGQVLQPQQQQHCTSQLSQQQENIK